MNNREKVRLQDQVFADFMLTPTFKQSLEKEMATHSNILAWKISWTEEPCGLQSMGLERVGDD